MHTLIIQVWLADHNDAPSYFTIERSYPTKEIAADKGVGLLNYIKNHVKNGWTFTLWGNNNEAHIINGKYVSMVTIQNIIRQEKDTDQGVPDEM